MQRSIALLKYPSAARSRPRRTPERSKDFTFVVKRRNRFWEVVDPAGDLVCLTVDKRGAVEVVRRLEATPNAFGRGVRDQCASIPLPIEFDPNLSGLDAVPGQTDGWPVATLP